MTRFVLLALLAVSLAVPSPAQERRTTPAAASDKTPADKAKERKDGDEKPAKEKEKEEKPPVVTHHSITLAGKPFAYTATAGYLPMKDENGKLKANVFFVSYTKDGASSRRPMTYAFNGGPGSSSVWLHLGAIGPKRVQMTDEGWPTPPPYRLVDNAETWLAFTDVVFIDPVTTGFSRPAEGEKAEQFHGLEEDLQSVGDFIRLWTTRYGRWASPKFLAGESYGTTRAAGLSSYLQNRHGMYLNGIVLMSTILNFQTARFDVGNDLPYVLFLPSYTAAAWYHKKLAPELEASLPKALEESEKFAAGPYTLALGKGANLPAAERQQVAQALARLTGLSAEYVDEHELRLTLQDWNRELLRKERRVVGRLDGRFAAPERGGDGISTDPSYAAIYGPFTAMLNDYVKGELKYENDLPYEILTDRVRPWSYATYENRYVNVAERLRGAMTQNPALKVLVAAGYYDFATPFFAAQYTFDHMGLDPSLQKNVRVEHYEAGHMMYIHKPSREKLTRDVEQLYRDAGAAD